MNRGRKTTKTCVQCLKQVPSARKSCIECGFIFFKGSSDTTDKKTKTDLDNEHPTECRARRRCRERPCYFDSLEFATTIKKKRKSLVKSQIKTPKLTTELTKDDCNVQNNSNVDTTDTTEDKPPSEASVSNSTESGESFAAILGRDEEASPRLSSERAHHYCNILSEINRKLSSISAQQLM